MLVQQAKRWGIMVTVVLGAVAAGFAAFALQSEAAPGDTATIVAYSIVCDSEADLPNWGPWGEGGGADRRVDPADVSAFLAMHEGECSLQSGWEFEWGNEYPYPSDEAVGYSGRGTLFGPTGADGIATAQIPAENEGDSVWLRVARTEGYYGYNGKSETEDVGSEFYCHTDLWHYDNLEVVHPAAGETYYCISFSAPRTELTEVEPQPAEGDARVRELMARTLEAIDELRSEDAARYGELRDLLGELLR